MAKDKAYMARYRSVGGASSSQEEMVDRGAGGYPKRMEELIDGDGHVSLNIDEYSGFSREHVENFLASQPYETHVIFAQDGTLVEIGSQWKNGSVNHTLGGDEKAIKASGSKDGLGYTDMHFHPESDNSYAHTLQIFSAGDIGGFTKQISAGFHGGSPYPYAAPDTFAVKSFDGYRFELRYVGGGKRDYKNFRSAYTRHLNKANREVDSYVLTHGRGYDRLPVDEISTRLDQWLRKNAANYGFEYTSNWDKKPVT